MAVDCISIHTKNKKTIIKKREQSCKFSIDRMMPSGYTPSERKRLKEFERKILTPRVNCLDTNTVVIPITKTNSESFASDTDRFESQIRSWRSKKQLHRGG